MTALLGYLWKIGFAADRSGAGVGPPIAPPSPAPTVLWMWMRERLLSVLPSESFVYVGMPLFRVNRFGLWRSEAATPAVVGLGWGRTCPAIGFALSRSVAAAPAVEGLAGLRPRRANGFGSSVGARLVERMLWAFRSAKLCSYSSRGGLIVGAWLRRANARGFRAFVGARLVERMTSIFRAAQLSPALARWVATR
jgi:hypothetical protein